MTAWKTFLLVVKKETKDKRVFTVKNSQLTECRSPQAEQHPAGENQPSDPGAVQRRECGGGHAPGGGDGPYEAGDRDPHVIYKDPPSVFPREPVCGDRGSENKPSWRPVADGVRNAGTARRDCYDTEVPCWLG